MGIVHVGMFNHRRRDMPRNPATSQTGTPACINQVAESLHRVPSARTIVRLITIGCCTLPEEETVTISAIEDDVRLQPEVSTPIEVLEHDPNRIAITVFSVGGKTDGET